MDPRGNGRIAFHQLLITFSMCMKGRLEYTLIQDSATFYHDPLDKNQPVKAMKFKKSLKKTIYISLI